MEWSGARMNLEGITAIGVDDMQGGMLGLNQSMASLGRIIGAMIGGFCFDTFGIRTPFPTEAGFLLIVLTRR